MTQLCAIGEVGDASACEGARRGGGARRLVAIDLWAGAQLSGLCGRRKDEATACLRERVIVVGVEVYGLRVKDLAEGMRMSPGSATRGLARASQRERKDRTVQEHRLVLEERLADLTVSRTGSRR
jgi:hypothetical protein